GIGLALVRRLIEMHGGSVTAHSDGLGKGSEFVIRLPRHVAQASELVRAPRIEMGTSPLEQTMAHADYTSRRILIADDNIDALESLAALLELNGHQVYSAANGVVALDSAERHRPQVALLDIGMPMLDGYEVARRIRAQPWGQRITLVALTGWGQESD